MVSLIALVFRLHSRLLLRRLRAAPRLDCGALRTAGRRLPRSVLLTGMTAPGPAGLLRSAAYDLPCVWFRTDVVRMDEDAAPADELRSSQSGGMLMQGSAGGPIGLTDHTGTVLLDLKLVLSGGAKAAVVRRRGEEAKLSLAHRADGGSGMARLEQAGLLPGSAYGKVSRRGVDLREEFIEPGRTVTVLARPRTASGGAIILGRPGAMSTDEPDAWIENLEARTASDAVMLKMFAIGLAVGAVGIALILAGA
jgi:hypothetical protein